MFGPLRRAAESSCRGLPGNLVDDGVVFRIGAAFDDLAVESFGYAPACRVLHRDRVNETFLAQVFMRPCSERSHDFPTKPLTVRAFFYPKAQFGRRRSEEHTSELQSHSFISY